MTRQTDHAKEKRVGIGKIACNAKAILPNNKRHNHRLRLSFHQPISTQLPKIMPCPIKTEISANCLSRTHKCRREDQSVITISSDEIKTFSSLKSKKNLSFFGLSIREHRSQLPINVAFFRKLPNSFRKITGHVSGIIPLTERQTKLPGNLCKNCLNTFLSISDNRQKGN